MTKLKNALIILCVCIALAAVIVMGLARGAG